MDISTIFKEKVRSSDVLSRVGGDEFAIIMYGCDLTVAKSRAEGLRQSLIDYRFDWGGKSFQVGVSIGIVKIDRELFPSKQVLFQSVDSFCYAAKRKGGNTIQVFNPNAVENIAATIERHSIAEISDALKSENMILHYQKIVPIRNNSVLNNYYELLVRMLDSKNSTIAPDEFLPVADRYGIMSQIDEWVLKKALRLILSDINHFETGSIVAINVSGKSLSCWDFRTTAFREIQRENITSNTLCIEITETSTISSIDDVVVFMRKMKKIGVIFALDDFGTGLSSFDYLKNLPIDILKIDGSFVKDLVTNSIDYSIIDSVKKISKVMKLKTIAEYVEYEEQFELLKEIGIDDAQGYFIAKPLAFKQS